MERASDTFQVENIDDLFKLLETKMDPRTGEDIHLKEQREAHEKKSDLLARKTIENQLLLTNCLTLRRTLKKPAYRDMMFLVGCSYIPDDLLDEEQGGSGGSGDEKKDEKTVE